MKTNEMAPHIRKTVAEIDGDININNRNKMKVGNNIIRLLKASLEERNKGLQAVDHKANQTRAAKHLAANRRLIAAHEKAVAQLKSAEKALVAVGITKNFKGYSVVNYQEAGLPFLSTPEVKLDRVLAELAGVDEKQGKAILAKYGVVI